MNKKLLKSFAAAAMSVLAIACAKEQVGPDEGAMVEATFSVDVPGVEVSTKGLSDAASVNELVFDAFRTQNDTVSIKGFRQVVAVENGRATIQVKLIKGQNYRFVFWAQKANNGYYNTDNLSHITVDYSKALANDSSLDAFFAKEEVSNVQNPLSKTIILKRPFAQVNYVTKEELGEGLHIEQSQITVKNALTSFNPLRNKLSGAKDVTFNYNAVPTEKLLIGGIEYNYLATAFILAKNDNSKDIVDVEAKFKANKGYSVTVSTPGLPCQRNYRTNVIGNFMSVDGTYNVEIDSAFKGDLQSDYVENALNSGQVVTLTEDYSLPEGSGGVAVPSGKTSVLNLNGKKFENRNGDKNNKAALQVRGMLTINGDGDVICEGGADNNAVLVEDGGHLIINGGTYYVEKDAKGKSNSTIYARKACTIEINGGVFSAEPNAEGKTPYVLNQADDLTVNCFSVKGGIFVGFNPADVNECHGKVTSFVAEGYRAVEITYEGKQAWKVEEIPAVTTHEDFNSAISSASAGVSATIKLASNMTAVLDNGIANEGDKSRNITFVGDGTQTFDVITKATNAEGGMLNYQRGSSFTFKNMSIKAGEGNFDGVVCDELVYENCTITGKLTLYGKATFVNCVFENTMANQYSIWTWGGTDVKFDKCTFNTNGKAILLYGQATEAKPTNLIVTNCTLNDRKNGSAGKAAIEIGNDYNATYNLTISDCVINGFAEGKNTGSKTWANKNSMDAAHLSVTIDRVKIQ
jgi:GLUG domain-containing protein